MVLGDVGQHMLFDRRVGPYCECEWGVPVKSAGGRPQTSCVALEIIAVAYRCDLAFPIHESMGGNLKMNIWGCGGNSRPFRVRRFGLVKVSWTEKISFFRQHFALGRTGRYSRSMSASSACCSRARCI